MAPYLATPLPPDKSMLMLPLQRLPDLGGPASGFTPGSMPTKVTPTSFFGKPSSPGQASSSAFSPASSVGTKAVRLASDPQLVSSDHPVSPPPGLGSGSRRKALDSPLSKVQATPSPCSLVHASPSSQATEATCVGSDISSLKDYPCIDEEQVDDEEETSGNGSGDQSEHAYNDAEGDSDGEPGDAQASPEAIRARQVAEAGGGLSGCTTVMIRHVPSKYTQQKLMREINSAGFLGRFDFLYLPTDLRTRTNRGFAFVNFISTDVAEEFYKAFHNQHLQHYASDRVIAVTPAVVQGFEDNAAHYASSLVRRMKTRRNRPLFFRPALTIGAEDVDVDAEKVTVSSPSRERGSRKESQRGRSSGQGSPGERAVSSKQASPKRSQQAPRTPPQQQPQSCASLAWPQVNPCYDGSDLMGHLQEAFPPPMLTEDPMMQLIMPRYCFHCGAPIEHEYNFCRYCGCHLGWPSDQSLVMRRTSRQGAGC